MTPLQAARHDLNCWVDECAELVGGDLKGAVQKAVVELEIAVDRLEASDDYKTLTLVEGIKLRLQSALELHDYEPPSDAEPESGASK